LEIIALVVEMGILNDLAAHQNYILWFYSLWWMINGIWPLCFFIFILL